VGYYLSHLWRCEKLFAVRESRSDGGKLASYEVAGGDAHARKEFVLKARWRA
jgi:hypothetical protein